MWWCNEGRLDPADQGMYFNQTLRPGILNQRPDNIFYNRCCEQGA